MSEHVDTGIAALQDFLHLLALINDVQDGGLTDEMWFRDWYAPLDDLSVTLDRYIGPELRTVEPQRMAAVSHLLSDSGPGWDLMATYLTLDTLRDHPELMALFVERLLGAIRDVLEGHKPPSSR